MKSSILALIPLFGLGALAQSTVVSIFFAGPNDGNAYVGSVVNADAKLTTYAIACTSGKADVCATGTSVRFSGKPRRVVNQKIDNLVNRSPSPKDRALLLFKPRSRSPASPARFLRPAVSPLQAPRLASLPSAFLSMALRLRQPPLSY